MRWNRKIDLMCCNKTNDAVHFASNNVPNWCWESDINKNLLNILRDLQMVHRLEQNRRHRFRHCALRSTWENEKPTVDTGTEKIIKLFRPFTVHFWLSHRSRLLNQWNRTKHKKKQHVIDEGRCDVIKLSRINQNNYLSINTNTHNERDIGGKFPNIR